MQLNLNIINIAANNKDRIMATFNSWTNIKIEQL
jgi:hypothetical protein